jgi:heme/copper-type cytochrome/quinol oxidase subunit 2
MKQSQDMNISCCVVYLVCFCLVATVLGVIVVEGPTHGDNAGLGIIFVTIPLAGILSSAAAALFYMYKTGHTTPNTGSIEQLRFAGSVLFIFIILAVGQLSWLIMEISPEEGDRFGTLCLIIPIACIVIGILIGSYGYFIRKKR